MQGEEYSGSSMSYDAPSEGHFSEWVFIIKLWLGYTSSLWGCCSVCQFDAVMTDMLS